LRELVKRGDTRQVQNVLEKLVQEEATPESDVDLAKTDSDGVTLVHIAAENGNVKVLETLVNVGKLSVKLKDERGGEPLLEAAAAGRLLCVKWLVKHGSDVNGCDNRGDTALHLACGFGHVSTIQWLIANGAKINSKTKINVTPLLYATAKGRLEAMKILLENGADVNSYDADKGWNAIHTAVGCNQAEAVRYLVTRFPNLLASKTLHGLTVDQVARMEKCPDSYVAVVEANKVSNKIARRKMLSEQRKKKAEEEAIARQLAIKQAEELEKEFFKKVSSKKTSGAKKASAKKKKKNTSTKKTCAIKTTQEKRPLPSDTKVDRTAKQVLSSPKIDTEMIEAEHRSEDTDWVIQVSRREKRKQLRANRSNNSTEDSVSSGTSEEDYVVVGKTMANDQKPPLVPRKMNKVVLTITPKSTPIENRWTLGNPLRTKKPLTPSSANDCGEEEVPMTENMEDGASSVGDDQQSEGPESSESDDSATKSRLRPHAPPWSPRRRRWTSPAANAGQVKTKVLVDDSLEEDDDVEDEFQRILKKFVHMDTGARRAAKRKFAKATAEYETKRLAEAAKMESRWRASIRSRLMTGVSMFKFSLIRTTLDEINAAEEARRLTEHFGSDDEDEPDEKNSILRGDASLLELVLKAKSVLVQKDHAPLDFKEWHKGVLIDVPSSMDATPSCADIFERNLRHSVEVLKLKGECKRAWLFLKKSQASLIPVATRIGFDFEHARPGYVELSYFLPTPDGMVSNKNPSSPTKTFQVKIFFCRQILENQTLSTQVLLDKKHGKWALPLLDIKSGEDPVTCAEAFVRQSTGYASSIRSLDQALNVFICTVCVKPLEHEQHFLLPTASTTVVWHAQSSVEGLLEDPADITFFHQQNQSKLV